MKANIKIIAAVIIAVAMTIGSYSLVNNMLKPKKEPAIDISLSEMQMKEICQLATLEAYYHNVARTNEPGDKFFLWKGKDLNFWIEYDGTIEMGINAEHVKMNIQGEKVTITIPDAMILSATVNEASLNNNAFYYAKNSVKATAKEQARAFASAEDKMKQEANQDKSLLEMAHTRAKTLLENYVKNVGDLVGIDYTVDWVYVNADGSSK